MNPHTCDVSGHGPITGTKQHLEKDEGLSIFIVRFLDEDMSLYHGY